jgi:hypothetical protein
MLFLGPSGGRGPQCSPIGKHLTFQQSIERPTSCLLAVSFPSALLPPTKASLTFHLLADSFQIASTEGTNLCFVGLDVLKAVVMKCSVFCDITPCSPLKVNRQFGGTCRLHLQGRRISRARKQHESKRQAELHFQQTIWHYANHSGRAVLA